MLAVEAAFGLVEHNTFGNLKESVVLLDDCAGPTEGLRPVWINIFEACDEVFLLLGKFPCDIGACYDWCI